MSELRQVVLTGFGAITARGDWTLQSAGEARLDPMSGTDFSIQDFALDKYLSSQKTYLDRCSALALAGAALALKDAQVEWPVSQEKFGITLGTHFGCLDTMKTFWDKALEKGPRLANPLLFSHSYFNSPISLCAIEFGLKSYHGTFCAGEYSGSEAVRAAFDAIRIGHAEAMLCGGVDALSPAREMCAPQEDSGEASVFFVLEWKEAALKRGDPTSHVLPESWLEAAFDLAEVHAQFGHCGGATSTLALAGTLSNSMDD